MDARDFAIKAHGEQKYGDEPYIVHLDAVAAILRGWGVTEGDLIDAAYLHDVLEDTDTGQHDLIERFGLRVTHIVEGCTGRGFSRAEAMASIYQKVATNGNAAVVKLADRIANVEAAERGSRHAERYLSEHRAFSEALKPYVPSHFWDRYVTAISDKIAHPQPEEQP